LKVLFAKLRDATAANNQISTDGTYVFPHLVFQNKSHFTETA